MPRPTCLCETEGGGGCRVSKPPAGGSICRSSPRDANASVLFITRKYPPSVGGMQKLSCELTTGVGRQVESRTIHWGGSQRWLPLFLVQAFVQATLMLLSGDVTLIHLGDPVLAPLGVALRAIRRVPMVVTAHGLDVTYPNPLYQAVVLTCLRRLDRVICISRYTRDECARRGVPATQCVVIPPGIDVEEYMVALPDPEREAWLSSWGIRSSGRRILLTSGRLVPRKGVAPFVLEALPLLMAQRRDWVYLIAGEGPERRSIEAAVRARGLSQHVRLLGLLDDRALKAAYAITDVFVMPNVPIPGDPEGFGLVVLEARAAGVPVVASNLEGIGDAIGGEEDGALVEPGNWAAFVAAINRWLDLQEAIADREARRKRVEAQFSWAKIISQYLNVFQEVQSAYRLHREGWDADSS